MKILLITQEPPLLTQEVVSGNAVRSQQIKAALETAGHRVAQVWLSKEKTVRKLRSETEFRNQDELQGILMKQEPEAIIVSYWELLALLPHEIGIPVILDYVAPRSLEELFESPDTVAASLRRLVTYLRRCDLLLVGNDLQKHLMVNTLIEAGFDLRGPDPVRVVPLGAEPASSPQSDPATDGWLFVSGGVTWPWRSAESYHSVLEAFAGLHQSDVRLIHFGGEYRWHGQNEDAGKESIPVRNVTSAVQFRELEPYRHFSRFLTSNAHIGVELAEWNIERQYSQSFRSLEFLRHGLPLRGGGLRLSYWTWGHHQAWARRPIGAAQ